MSQSAPPTPVAVTHGDGAGVELSSGAATAILERITDAFFALDDRWQFSYVNRQAHFVLGHEPGTLVGRNIWEAFPEAVKSRFYTEYHRAVDEQVPTSFTEFYPPLDAWFEVNAYPGPGGLSVYFRDVTRQRRVQDELTQSRTHLGLALEAGGMGTWEWDIVGGRVHWSPRQEELYGLEPGSFDGSVEAYRALIHPDDVATSWKAVEDALARHAREHHIVHRIVRADGETRWLESHGRFVYDTEGRPRQLVGVSADVTERMRFEHLRVRQEEMLGAVDVGVWYCDLPFDVLAWDAKVKEHFWLSPDETVTIERFYAIIHPDDRERTRTAIERSIASRAPYDVEYRTVAPEGHPQAGAVKWVRAIGYTAYDVAGRPIRFDGVTVDVTNAKRFAERLAVSEQRYMYAARATSNAIWDWNLVTNEVTWNPGVYSVFGYGEAEVEETAAWWYEQIHPDDRERVVEGIHRVIDGADGGHAWRDEYRYRRADGSYARVTDRGYVARDESGRALRMIGAMEDVTARTDMEQALRYQHYIRDTITNNATAALFMMNAEGHCTFMNPAAERMIGFTLDEIREIPLHYAIHHHRPDGSPYAMADCPVDRALPENFDVRAHEDVFIRKDGTYFPVLCAASPIFEHGVPVGTVVEVRDVTEERRRERALRESEARFRSLAEALPVQVWTARPDGALDYVSGRGVDYFGQPLDSLLGDGWTRFVHPDDLPSAGARWTASLSSGAPYESEFRLRRHDGTWRWHLARALAIRDSDGGIMAWFGSNTDFEAQKVAEQARDRALGALELERTRLAELLEQAPASISMTRGPEHVGMMQNALSREIAGRDIVGRPVRAVFPELDGQGLFELLDQVYASGEPVNANEVHVRWDRDADGRPEAEGYFNVVYQPIRGADGKVEGVLSHSVEVTAQVRARQEIEAKAAELARLTDALERSNRELDQFAYVTSHDLKAPLRGIANLTQWIEEDLGSRVTGQSAEHMRLLKGRVHRMEALIDGILTYSRAARSRSAPEPIDTGALVTEVLDLLSPPEGAVVVAPGLPSIETERVPLQQVFMNLIGNALKHGRADAPRVEVAWRDAGAMIEFSVRDNGPGIAPEFHERIWGIFQTLEARDKVEGTGIGLAVVKKIVESRHGRAWVESAAGTGATFLFTWPKRA